MTYLKHITCAFCGRRRVDDGTNTCPGCIRDKENKDTTDLLRWDNGVDPVEYFRPRIRDKENKDAGRSTPKS